MPNPLPPNRWVILFPGHLVIVSLVFQSPSVARATYRAAMACLAGWLAVLICHLLGRSQKISIFSHLSLNYDHHQRRLQIIHLINCLCSGENHHSTIIKKYNYPTVLPSNRQHQECPDSGGSQQYLLMGIEYSVLWPGCVTCPLLHTHNGLGWHKAAFSSLYLDLPTPVFKWLS